MPAGAPGKTTDCRPGRERGDLIVFFIPGLDAVPAQAVVQRQILLHAPAILRVQAGILVAAVERLKLALVVLARNAQQEVREVDAGLAAEEDEIAVQLGDRIGIDLIVVELAAHFDRVRSHDLGKTIAPLKGIVDLLQLVGVGPDGEVIEIDAFHALGFGRQRDDARRIRAHHESLRREAGADAANRAGPDPWRRA